MMTLHEVSKKYAIPGPTASRWIREGKLPARRKARRWTIRESNLLGSVEAWEYVYRELQRCLNA